MEIAGSIRIVEVGPRDGLQNEPARIATTDKIALIEGLAEAGLTTIEAGSFVSPKWVPSMADTAAVLAGLRRQKGVRYAVLVPNLKGLEQAIAAGAHEVAVFAAASETFSQRNLNCSITESLERFAPVCAVAQARGMPVRGYVSCVLGCPYEGAVAADAVASVAADLAALGCYEISLGDTIGVGTPLAARRLIERVARVVPIERLAAHFHDTYGQALANLLAVIEVGIRVVDSSVAGLGGCPYAPGAAGNVATEDVVYMLNGMAVNTGVDLDRLIAVGQNICAALGRSPVSKVTLAKQARNGQ